MKRTESSYTGYMKHSLLIFMCYILSLPLAQARDCSQQVFAEVYGSVCGKRGVTSCHEVRSCVSNEISYSRAGQHFCVLCPFPDSSEVEAAAQEVEAVEEVAADEPVRSEEISPKEEEFSEDSL